MTVVHRRGGFVVLAGCAVVAAIVAGCSSHDQTTPQPPVPAPSPSPSPTPATTVDYMLPGQTQVELLSLNISDPNNVSGFLTDVYNCGDGRSAHNSELGLSGVQRDASTVDLTFDGVTGQFESTANSAGALLSGPGGSEQFELISDSNSLQNAVGQIPPIASVSGYSCADLPANAGP